MTEHTFGEIKADLTNDGTPVGIIFMMDGKEHSVDYACDIKGDDWEEDSCPPAFKVVETSYKRREDGGLIAFIQTIGKHPKANYQSYRDEDGDQVWRVVFQLKDCPNYRKRAEEIAKEHEEKIVRLRSKWTIHFVRPDEKVDFFNQTINGGSGAKNIAIMFKDLGIQHWSMDQTYSKGDKLLEDLEAHDIPEGNVWLVQYGWCAASPSMEALEQAFTKMTELARDAEKRRVIHNVQTSLQKLSLEEILEVTRTADAQLRFKRGVVHQLAKLEFSTGFEEQHANQTDYVQWKSCTNQEVTVAFKWRGDGVLVELLPRTKYGGVRKPFWSKEYSALDADQVAQDTAKELTTLSE